MSSAFRYFLPPTLSSSSAFHYFLLPTSSSSSHHHHLSLNREGRWGTTYDFATSFLHFSLFSTALWDLANSRTVHSLILSSHLFPVCLVFFPFSLCLARWFWQDLMNGRHDHTTAVLQWSSSAFHYFLPPTSSSASAVHYFSPPTASSVFLTTSLLFVSSSNAAQYSLPPTSSSSLPLMQLSIPYH